MDLRFLIQKATGETALTIVVSLRTPPALLFFDQKSLSEIELGKLKNEDRLKEIEFKGERYVFVTNDGERRHIDSFLEPLQKAAKRAGIAKRIDLHTLRHLLRE